MPDESELRVHPTVHSLIVAVATMLQHCRCTTLPAELILDGHGHPITSRWDHEEACPLAVELAVFPDGPEDPDRS
jgi:hypothetical protein